MKVLSTETFHIIFDKHIALASAYMDNPTISFIIKSCRLKPKDIIFGEYKEKILLYRHWIDEVGNSLEITEKKKIKIQLNDLTLNRDKLTTSDLYENLSIDKVARISRLAFCIIAKDEDLQEDHAIVSFLGIDGFLRTYCLLYGEWSKIPNLYLGFNILQQIACNEDIKHFIEIKIKDMPYPCTNVKAALSFMPPSNSFIKTLKCWNESVLNTISGEII